MVRDIDSWKIKTKFKNMKKTEFLNISLYLSLSLRICLCFIFACLSSYMYTHSLSISISLCLKISLSIYLSHTHTILIPPPINQSGWTALMYASGEGHLPIVMLLTERGADIDMKDKDVCYLKVWFERKCLIYCVWVCVCLLGDIYREIYMWERYRERHV